MITVLFCQLLLDYHSITVTVGETLEIEAVPLPSPVASVVAWCLGFSRFMCRESASQRAHLRECQHGLGVLR